MSLVDVRILLVVVAVLLMLVGAVVFRRQARATSCPRHSRIAGKVAMAAGWLSLIGGIGLLGYVLFVIRG